MFGLQIDTLVGPVNEIMKISPYNAMAFGALVLLLIYITLYLRKKLEAAEEYNKVLVEKNHQSIDVITEKLNSIKSHGDSKDAAIITALEDIKRKLDSLFNNNKT